MRKFFFLQIIFYLLLQEKVVLDGMYNTHPPVRMYFLIVARRFQDFFLLASDPSFKLTPVIDVKTTLA